MGVPHSVGRSTVSMMSLTPNGTPASGPCLPFLSKARATASVASRSRCAQAWTSGSRAPMRSRQAPTTASQVVCPWPIAAMISVAVSSLSGLMELPLAANGAIEPHSGQAAHQRGSHAQETNQLGENQQAERSFFPGDRDRGAGPDRVHLRHDVAAAGWHYCRHWRYRGADPPGLPE